MSTPLRIGISLGASFLGYATHAGFLNRLHELGVRPVGVAGSSAGAIAAGLYAARLDRQVIKDTVLSPALRHAFMRKTPWWTHYARVTFNSTHVSAMHPRGAVEYLEKVVGDQRIEDLTAPSYLTAVTDLNACRAIFLREGSLASAMVASCCVPTLMSPLEHAGLECFDGGILHEAPVDPWLEAPDIDVIVIHRILHPASKPKKFFPLNIFNTAGRVLSCAGEQLLHYRQRLASFHGKTLLVSETCHERPSMFSSNGMGRYYETGEERAQEFYDGVLKPLLNGAVAAGNQRQLVGGAA